MKKPRTQYRIMSNGIDYRIQQLEITWFGLRERWEDIWSHGEVQTFDDYDSANLKIAEYIRRSQEDNTNYEPVSTIIS